MNKLVICESPICEKVIKKESAVVFVDEHNDYRYACGPNCLEAARKYHGWPIKAVARKEYQLQEA